MSLSHDISPSKRISTMTVSFRMTKGRERSPKVRSLEITDTICRKSCTKRLLVRCWIERIKISGSPKDRYGSMIQKDHFYSRTKYVKMTSVSHNAATSLAGKGDQRGDQQWKLEVVRVKRSPKREAADARERMEREKSASAVMHIYLWILE